MVGTGANRMPLTKVHPILLGKQNNDNKPGNSLLAQHRQMHNDRMQQQQRQQSPGQVINELFGQIFLNIV